MKYVVGFHGMTQPDDFFIVFVIPTLVLTYGLTRWVRTRSRAK